MNDNTYHSIEALRLADSVVSDAAMYSPGAHDSAIDHIISGKIYRISDIPHIKVPCS